MAFFPNMVDIPMNKKWWYISIKYHHMEIDDMDEKSYMMNPLYIRIYIYIYIYISNIILNGNMDEMMNCSIMNIIN